MTVVTVCVTIGVTIADTFPTRRMAATHSFGYWVRRQRKALDLTQKALAQRAACSAAMIRKIEAGERKPSSQLAAELAEALSVPSDRRETFVAAARGLARVADLPLADEPLAESPESATTRLPSTATPFFGRESELAVLDKRLAAGGTRILTLMGAGGAGKTRLALEAAHRAQAHFPDGIYFVPLTGVDDPQHLVTAIASAVDLVFAGPSKPRQQLVSHLRGRRLLLLLDNFEQLLPAGADLLAGLVHGTPELAVLVTSRERLQLQMEVVVPVAGVALETARALFIERARRADTTLNLSSEQAREAITAICHLVGGLPLAVELAATWVRVLSPQEILSDLQSNTRLLTGDLRDLPPRQRSMKAVFNASWQLLSPDLQQVLARLSVFAGSFSRDAAAEVCGATTRQLASLLDRSLCERDGARFSLHTLLRQFAGDRLQAMPGERAAVQERHATYYLTLLSQVSERLMYGGPPLAEWQDIVNREIDNIHIAWQWAITHDRPSLLRSAAFAFYHHLDLRGQVVEGTQLFRQFEKSAARASAAGETGDPGRRRAEAMAIAVQAGFGIRTGAPDARQRAMRALDLLDGLHAPDERATALNFHALLALLQGDAAAAQASAEQALALGRREDHPWATALACNALGLVHLAQDRPERARDMLHAALTIWDEQLDLAYGKMRAMIILGLVYHGLAQYDRARNVQKEALALAKTVQDHSLTSMSLSNLAFHHYALGEVDRAAAGFHAAIEEAQRFNLTPSILHGVLGRGLTAAAQGQTRQAVTILSFGLAQPGLAQALLLGEPQRVLADLRAELPRSLFARAEARAQEMTMEELLAGL